MGAPIEIVGGANVAVAAGQPIELAFDRLLMPLSILRQTFVLEDLQGNLLGSSTTVSYDPVARVVTITPPDGTEQTDKTYRLLITTPTSATDPNGLRAIDGATLDPKWTQPLTIPVLGTDGGAPVSTVDFCTQILPIFQNDCLAGSCHGPPAPPPNASPAAGLWLSTADGVSTTAIGRVAEGSNTGPSSVVGTVAPAPPKFGLDMPLIDNNAGGPTGDPGNSWLLYKLLLAVPGAPSDGGAPAHSVPWQTLSDNERATLSNFVPGREMPFPSNPAAQPGPSIVTTDQLELISFWIAQGASVQCQ